MYGISWIYMLPMVMTGALGVLGTLATQYFTSRNAARTTSGTIATSTASELWQENSRLVDRLTKEIDRLAGDVDHMREELRRMRAERDQALLENAALQERLHGMELELQRLKFAQGAQAVTTVKVETSPAAAAAAAEERKGGPRDA